MINLIIKPESQFRNVNQVGIHRLTDKDSLESDLVDTIEQAERDNFEAIYLYKPSSIWLDHVLDTLNECLDDSVVIIETKSIGVFSIEFINRE